MDNLPRRESTDVVSEPSDHEFRTVFQRAPIGIAVVDRNGRPIQCNPALEYFLGYTEAELQTMHFSQFTHPEDRSNDLKLFNELLDGKREAYHIDKRYVRKDGTTVWGKLTVSLIPLSGRAGNVVGIVEDVTDDHAKRADRDRLLHDLGERVKELTALHGTARLLQDDALEVRDVMDSIARLIPPAFQYPDVTAARLTFDDVAVATPGFRVTPWRLQASSRTRDDRALTMEIVYLEERPPSAEGPFLAEERNLIRSMAEMFVVFLDRRRVDRELRRSEQGLRRSEFYLAQGQRLARTGSWALNRDETSDYWSPEMFRIFGRDPGKGPPTLTEFVRGVHLEDREPVYRALKSMAAEANSGDLRFRAAGPDGDLFVRVVGMPVHEPEGGLIGTCIDVTEHERLTRELQSLKDQLFKENLALKEEIDRSSMFEEIVGASPKLQATLRLVAQVAPTDSTVLISGETGTGKELIARAIHKRSLRAGKAFVSVNCAAIPQGLIGSELFGHEKGAFTGAIQRRIGRFELAEGGTIFLDEVGELPAETQVTLLRVLQDRSFERVGGNQSVTADVRVIAATNRDLEAAINDGTFRRDLFYRLHVFPVEIAPLRERKEDIPLLVQYFINRFARKAGKRIRTINKRTLTLLESYAWPGNIRELQNVIERSVIVSEAETFSVDERWLSRTAPLAPHASTLSRRPQSEIKQLIEAALAETRGLVSGPAGAAAKLGVPASTLESKIRTLGIDKQRFKKAWPPPAR